MAHMCCIRMILPGSVPNRQLLVGKYQSLEAAVIKSKVYLEIVSYGMKVK